MLLRAIPPSFNPDVVTAIDARLDRVERDEHVLIPLAIESGSRAWGFASPDSDYDCRFLYLRPRDAYLSLWPVRDVIETPLDALLDVNGWDVAKALRLIVKGNAVAIEWLRSPVAYRGDSHFRDLMQGFALEYAPLVAVRRHYLHLGLAQWRRHGAGQVSGKKLFYALRPAAALRWMRLHGDALPPMHFPTLMAECEPDHATAACVEELLMAKAQTRELGRAAVPPPVAAFIDAEYRLAAAADDLPIPDGREAADALFRRLVEEYAPS